MPSHVRILSLHTTMPMLVYAPLSLPASESLQELGGLVMSSRFRSQGKT